MALCPSSHYHLCYYYIPIRFVLLTFVGIGTSDHYVAAAWIILLPFDTLEHASPHYIGVVTTTISPFIPSGLPTFLEITCSIVTALPPEVRKVSCALNTDDVQALHVFFLPTFTFFSFPLSIAADPSPQPQERKMITTKKLAVNKNGVLR